MIKSKNNYQKSINLDNKLEILDNFLNDISKKTTLSKDDIINIYKQKKYQKTRKKRKQDKKKYNTILSKNNDFSIPIEIFSQTNGKLSCLETIVKYLREEKSLKFNDIAKKTYRKPGPIGVTYRNSKKKYDLNFKVDKTDFKKSTTSIPLSLFSNKKLSVMENIVSFLKQSHGFTLAKISEILSRDQRTIWTIYSRSQNKLGGKIDNEAN